MAKIKINEDGLRENKKAIEAKISELHSLNERLTELIFRIRSSWEGDASTQYINTMTHYKQKAETMIDVLTEFRKYIDEALRRFEEIDSNGAKRIQSI